MDTNFNPYHQWLGLDAPTVQPNYYEVFGLDAGEQNTQKIAEAADHAISKVRSCRPGPHAAVWASLLDELQAAKTCLLDAHQRAQYDAQLRQTGTDSSRETNHAQPLADFSSQSSPASGSNNMYPPGMGSSPATPQPQTQPAPGTQVPTGPYGADANRNAPPQAPLAGQPAPAQPQPAQPQPAQPQSAQPQQYAPQSAMPATPAPQTPSPQAPLAGGPYSTPTAPVPAANPMTPTANPAAPLPTPQNPTTQMPGAGQPAYPAAPAQPAAPAAGTPVPHAAQPMSPGTHAAVANPMDPMAPVNIGDAPSQPQVAQPQANPAPAAAPVTPAGPDPMAPAAPAGSANPSAAGAAVPLGGAHPTAVAQPVGGAATQPTDPSSAGDSAVQVGGAESNIAKASVRRNQTRRTLTTVAIGVVMCLLSASVIGLIVNSAIGDKDGDGESPVAQADQVKSDTKTGDNSKGKEDDVKDDSPESSPTPRPTPTPRTTPQPEPTPSATPTPMPQPEPAPMPEPEPTPAPPPEPMPTAEETRMLGQAMQAAREALENKNPEAAAEEIAKVESLTMTDEHKAMLNRLAKVTGLVQEFWNAEKEARIQLTGLDILKTPADNEIVIVESSPEMLIVRAPGENKRFGPREEHTKFAALLADQVLSPDDPNTLFIKGAVFVVEEDPKWHPEGVEMWKKAAGFSDEGTELLSFLEDSYDLAGE